MGTVQKIGGQYAKDSRNRPGGHKWVKVEDGRNRAATWGGPEVQKRAMEEKENLQFQAEGQAGSTDRAADSSPSFYVYNRNLMLKVLALGVSAETDRNTRTADDSKSTVPNADDHEAAMKESKDVTHTVAQASLAPSTPLNVSELPEGREQASSSRRALKASKKTAKARTTSDMECLKASREAVEAGMAKDDLCDGTDTTVMLRNIPNQYTREMLTKCLDDKGFKDQYDFLYLPIDTTSQRNMGYAFVNFRTVEACQRFTRQFSGVGAATCLPGFRSSKICEVRRAVVQGLRENMERMRTRFFIEQLADHEEWQPIFLDEQGKRIPLVPKEGESRKLSDPSKTSSSRKSKKALGSSGSHVSSQCATAFSTGTSHFNMLDSPMMVPMMSPYTFLPYTLTDDQADDPGGEIGDHQLRAEAPEFTPVVKASGAEAASDLMCMDVCQGKVRKQIEFYFSVNNVCHDLYLRTLMDEAGWVPLDALMRFPKLVELGATEASAAAALEESKSVEVHPNGAQVRISNETLRKAFPRASHSGVGLRGVAAGTTQSPIIGPATAEAGVPEMAI